MCRICFLLEHVSLRLQLTANRHSVFALFLTSGLRPVLVELGDAATIQTQCSGRHLDLCAQSLWVLLLPSFDQRAM
jgi:hypothetical protein